MLEEEVKALIRAVETIQNGAVKAEFEREHLHIIAYRMGGLIRVDIKEIHRTS